MRILFVVVLFFITLTDIQSQELKSGDLLFQDINCGPLCEAIGKVTKGIYNHTFSHVGMVIADSTNQFSVIEAIGDKVRLTPLDSFLQRSVTPDGIPKVVCGSVLAKDSAFVNNAVLSYAKYLGKAYDDTFYIDNDAYYCSELIYFLYQYNNQPLFQLQPMTFNDPQTNLPFQEWIDYFNSFGASVPEGHKGINPGLISRSDHIIVSYPFGNW